MASNVRSFLRVTVLIWVDLFAAYVMWMMMIYLTDVWKLDYTNAAAIINIWMGAALILPLPLSYLADAFLGNFCLLLLTTLSYLVGLGLLWMSTPPVLAKSYGNCIAYKPECIGDHQRVLFYAGLALIALGMAGHSTFLGPFTLEQTDGNFENNVEDGEVCCFCLGSFAAVLIPIIGIIVVAFVKPWATLLGICCIFSIVSTLVFLSGVCSYKYVRPQGSPMTTIFRVFLASFSKVIYRRPRNVNDLYESPGLGQHDSLAHTKVLRCLDKAAIVLPQQPLEQQEQNRWRLCSVTEVEETKIVIRMIPMWLTFILVGVVSAIGNTYFLEQAKHLNRKVGRIKVPLIILLWFYDHGKDLFSKLYLMVFNSSRDSEAPKRRYVPPVGVAIAMIFSILCCITAAKVETRRLDIVKSHGLVDKPDEKIPMSIFWLLPQFALLGAMDGIYTVCVTCFFGDQMPPSMVRYMIIFSEAVFGAGVMGSALSVYIVEKKTDWFKSTLNMSRLYNYYWVLAALSAANFLLYVVMAVFYRYRDASLEDLDEPDAEDDDDDCCDVNCCC